jgi:hypothetical protein
VRYALEGFGLEEEMQGKLGNSLEEDMSPLLAFLQIKISELLGKS